jgi:Zn finger protein HypA/HybF involved in hydrogenase expression
VRAAAYILHCVVCEDLTGPVQPKSLICAQCGFPLKIVSGKELEIEYIEIEEPELTSMALA